MCLQGLLFPIANTADKTYEMPSPPSHQPLPAIPLSVALTTGGNVGVTKEGEEEGVYDNIPNDISQGTVVPCI